MPRTPKGKTGFTPGISRSGNRTVRCVVPKLLKLTAEQSEALQDLAADWGISASDVLKRLLMHAHAQRQRQHPGTAIVTVAHTTMQNAPNADARHQVGRSPRRAPTPNTMRGARDATKGDTTKARARIASKATAARASKASPKGTSATKAAPKTKPQSTRAPDPSPGRSGPEAVETALGERAGSLGWPANIEPQPFPARSATTAPSFGHDALDTKQAAPENTGLSTGAA